MAGAVNTLFGFAVYSGAIVVGIPVWAALLVANATGIVFNFVTTGGYAFRERAASRFPRFCAAYLLVYLVNWALLAQLGAWVPGAIAAQALLTAPMAVLSYLIMARFVFAPAKVGPGP